MGHVSWYAAYCILRNAYDTRRTSSIFVHLDMGTWKGAGCQRRPRALGLRRGAAAVGDELKSTGSSSCCCSITCLLSFFVFQFADVRRNNKPCIIVLQIITLSVLRFFIKINVLLTVICGVGRLERYFVDMFAWWFATQAVVCRPNLFLDFVTIQEETRRCHSYFIRMISRTSSESESSCNRVSNAIGSVHGLTSFKPSSLNKGAPLAFRRLPDSTSPSFLDQERFHHSTSGISRFRQTVCQHRQSVDPLNTRIGNSTLLLDSTCFFTCA